MLLSAVPLLLLSLSLGAAIAIFFLSDDAGRIRTTLNLVAATVKLLVIAALFPLILREDIAPELRAPFLPGIDFVLQIDSLALLFAGLSAVLWLLTTIYAVGYLERRPNRSRFFGFFNLCVTATVGISFAGNLPTFLVFYELLSLVTYPLVVHYGTKAALHAGRLYLFYALSGGLLLLLGTAWLTSLVGPVPFTPGGVSEVAALATAEPGVATAIFALLLTGLGVKAAIFPLHSWLPRAMVAPAPVSALLHAVAVVKAGVFGLTRVVDDLYGVQVAADLGVLQPLLVLAAVTIVYGSVRALLQDDIKKRLAYSTVSQVSYIALGLALATTIATTGALVHVVHQGLAKITLFFCAGLVAEVLGISKVGQLRGLGRRMPLTAIAFSVAALSMIGLPPTAGFVTKWHLGLGAAESGHLWVIGILVVSALLNAAYFLPLLMRMWFDAPPEDVEQPTRHRAGLVSEAPLSLLLPALATTALTLGAGITAGVAYSPLDIAQQIAERVYQ